MKGKGKRKRKGKERWKEDSLRNVGCRDAHTDTQVILYSVQCYALHWTDNGIENNISIFSIHRVITTIYANLVCSTFYLTYLNFQKQPE